jgi:hypothetical protein
LEDLVAPFFRVNEYNERKYDASYREGIEVIGTTNEPSTKIHLIEK